MTPCQLRWLSCEHRFPGSFQDVVVKHQYLKRCLLHDAVSAFPGNAKGGITCLDARVVVLPEYQGLGVGTPMS